MDDFTDFSSSFVNWSDSSKLFWSELQVLQSVDSDTLNNQSKDIWEPRKGIGYIHKPRSISIKRINKDLIEVSRVMPHSAKPTNLKDMLDSNSLGAICKSRKRCIDIIQANADRFKFFFTFTLSPEHFDRMDGKTAQEKISKMFNNMGVEYLFIAERHQDGAIHFHGVATATLERFLIPYIRKDYAPFTDVKLPYHILDDLNNGIAHYHLKRYDSNFGYCDITAIKSLNALSYYITKYINKDVCRLGRRRFFASKSLAKPELIPASEVDFNDFEPDSYNGFSDYTCKVRLVRKKPSGADSLEPSNRSLLKGIGSLEPIAKGVGTVEPHPIAESDYTLAKQDRGISSVLRAECSEGSRRLSRLEL